MHLFNTQTNVGNKHLQQNIFTAHRLPCRSFNCVNFEINLNAQRRLIKRFQLYNRYLGNVVVKNCKSTFFLKAFTVKIAFGTFTCNKRKICTLTLQTKSCNITSLPMKKQRLLLFFPGCCLRQNRQTLVAEILLKSAVLWLCKGRFRQTHRFSSENACYISKFFND